MEFNEFFERFLWVVILICGEYILVLFSVLADLISGVRKAKQRGEARRSTALRRTVDKVSRYYVALFALTIIDMMQMSAISYLRLLEGFDSFLLFPLFTLLGSLGIALIEVKSIYEKAEEKEQRDYRDAASLLKSILSNKYLMDMINTNDKKLSK